MFRSLRVRLFLWYVSSLLLIGVFFYIFIHVLSWPYGLETVLALFILLAAVGFLIIYRITSSIVNLSRQIQKITSKNLDQRLAVKSNDEIGELSRSFNNLLERLTAAFKREQQFIADVAHEMKTPLATVRSLLEVTLEKPRTEADYKKSITESLVEVGRVSNTLKNVLDLAWSESPIGRAVPKQVDLDKLMTELVDITERLGEPKKIKFVSKIVSDVSIVGYRDKLAQAIINILENAVKYTSANGVITIRLEKEAMRAVIGISDTGRGIPEGDRPHIFDRFYRSRNSLDSHGSGLGLAITKSIIALHFGEITVKSEVGRGTTFVIVLPLTRSS